MITQITGKVIEKQPTHLVINCKGIGYFINISLQTYDKIIDKELLTIYTHLHIKEDAHTLFGFYDKLEREIFRLLISVSGIGTSVARTMLSSLNTREIQNAIVSENASQIQSIKGIGLKTAQRVILDLKDKITKTTEIEKIVQKHASCKDDALIALETLGFSRRQSEKVVDKIVAETPDITIEQLIRKALKNL